jgi:hypothetical protein
MNSIKVLAKVEEASMVHLLLAPEVFYNQLISDKMDMQARGSPCLRFAGAPDASVADRKPCWLARACVAQLHLQLCLLQPEFADVALELHSAHAAWPRMQDHYLAWRQSHNNDHRSPAGMGPFSFCSFPFLLNAKAKTRLLQACPSAAAPSPPATYMAGTRCYLMLLL